MMIKVGDKVRIHPDNVYYFRAHFPRLVAHFDEVGIVVSTDEEYQPLLRMEFADGSTVSGFNYRFEKTNLIPLPIEELV